jgi:hypothetical protein
MDSNLLAIFLILSFIVGGAIGLRESKRTQAKQQETLTDAYRTYQNALKKLSADPTNPGLKQRALDMGRVYSNLTRNKKGVTIFDEIALMNDINAATASATNLIAKPSPTGASASVEARLWKLADLKATGTISEQEYAAKRQKIIDEM